MPISVRCTNPACGKVLQVPDAYAGKVGRCPACQQKVVLNPTKPAAASTAGPASEAVKPTPAPRPTSAAQVPERIGRFVVRARLGAGAFGTVYRAWDPQLERDVALKVPQAAVLDSPKRVERFLREAKAAAGLRHPSIVPVYDAGEDGEVRYIASAFVEGKPLAAAVEEKGIDPRRAATIVRQLAEALGYAHGQSIVHRDVKPANVMLDADDKPHLMDFGLASKLDSIEKLTQEGAVMGTPAYMAPEQARGQQGEAKPESDQYALGVVLYELLTGRTPFEGPPQIVLFNVLQTEPPAPRKLRKDVPRDLETICLKAMAKRAEDRYSDCQALADDLGRWLEGEPIRARRLGIGERFVRWCKREPKLAAASGLLALSLLVLIGAAGLVGIRHYHGLYVEKAQKLDQTEQALGKTKAELDAEKEGHAKARRDVNLGLLAQAQTRLADDPAGAFQALGGVPEAERNWVWRHLRLRAEGSGVGVRVLRTPGDERFVGSGLNAIAFSADSQRLGGLTHSGLIHAWHVGSGLGLKTLTLTHNQGHWPQSAVLSGDGRIAATVNQAQQVPFDVHPLTAVAVAGLAGSSPDGPLLTVSRVRAVRGQPFWESGVRPPRQPRAVAILDAASGEILRELTAPAGDQVRLHLSHDGKILVYAAGDWNQPMEVRVYDTSTGKEMEALRQRLKVLRHLAISPDGKTIVTVSGDFSKPAVLALLDGETGQESGLKLEGDLDGVEQIAFSSDGKFILGSGGGWHERHVAKVIPTTVQFDVDVKKKRIVEKEVEGKKVEVVEEYVVKEKVTKTEYKTVTEKHVSAGAESVLVIWDATGKRLHRLPGCPGGLVATVSPDGTLLARICHGPSLPVPHLSLYDLTDGARLLLKTPVPEGIHVSQLLFSPDGHHLAGMQQGGRRVVLWSAIGSRLLYQYDAHNGPVNALSFSADRLLISSYSACNAAARTWVARTGETLIVTRSGGMHGGYGYGGFGHARTSTPCCSADGEQLVGRSEDGKLAIWDRKTGKPIDVPKDVGTVLAISPDCRLIVTAPEPKLFVEGQPLEVPKDGPPLEVTLRDARTGKAIFALKGLPPFGARFEFSPDSKRLVSSVSLGWGPTGPRGEVKVWDVSTGEVLLTHAESTGAFALSGDGGRLAIVQPPAAAPPPQWKEPDVPKVKEEPVSFEEGAVVRAAPPVEAPKHDSRVRIKVFDLASGKELRTIVVKQGVGQIQRLEFGHDGKFLAGVGGVLYSPPRQVLAWDASSGMEVLSRDDFADEMAFSPDGARLALAVGGRRQDGGMMPRWEGEDGSAPVPAQPDQPLEVKVYDLASGRASLSLLVGKERLAGLAFSEDGGRIVTSAGVLTQEAAAAGASDVRVWDARSGKVIFTFTGHTGVVSAVAFSPDGTLLATGGYDGSVKVWLLSLTITVEGATWESGRPVTTRATLGERRLRHWDRVDAVAFSPDGGLVASVGGDGVIRLHDAETGVGKGVLSGHQSGIRGLAFRHDGKVLASASFDHTVRLWDVASGKEIRTLRHDHRWGGPYPGTPVSIVFSPDGKTLATGHEGGQQCPILLWDADSGKRMRVIAAHKNSVVAVCFRPGGKELASASFDGTVKLWDVADGKEVRAWEGHKGGVWSVQFTPDGKELVTGGNDGTVRVWETDTGKQKRSLSAGGVAYWVAVSPDGKIIASGHNEVVKLWNETDDKPMRTLGGHRWEVRGVAFDRGGKRLASCCLDRTVRLWDVESGKELSPPEEGHVGQTQAVAYSPDGKTLASAGADGTVRLWDVGGRRERAVLKGHESPVWAVLFLDEKQLASAGEDGRVRLWDVESGKEVRRLEHKDSGPARSLALSPDGKSLAVGYHHGHAVRAWDLASGKVTHTFAGHKADVWSLLFTPDGKTLVTGSHDWTVKLWSLEENKEKRTLAEGDPGAVWSMALLDGKTLIVGHEHGRLRQWDLAKGKLLREERRHESPVYAVALSEGGKLLASGDSRARVKLWEPKSGIEWETVPLGPWQGRVAGVAFCPKTGDLATANGDGTVTILRLPR